MSLLYLTCWHGRTGFVGAGHLLQLAGELAGALDVLARVPALAQWTAPLVQLEAVRTQHATVDVRTLVLPCGNRAEMMPGDVPSTGTNEK